MTHEIGFPDLSAAIEKSPASQGRVAAYLGYRGDVFSKVLNGYQPPKGGIGAGEFRAAVRAALMALAAESEGAA